jgi:metallo-beta-lactamase class B
MEKTASLTRSTFAVLILGSGLLALAAQATPAPTAAQIAVWNAPHAPYKVYGNTYYVGTQGLSAVLITSDFGHVLIDGGLPESAPQIIANIEKLGFKPTDVKALLNSHAHFDHAGGLAELQRVTGAPLYLRRPSEEVLRTGKLGHSDPQFGLKAPVIAPAKTIWIVSDEQWLGVGSNRLRAWATAGHTPGGTTWTWESCEGQKCLQMVYADSLSPVSADRFRFTASKDYPSALADFEQAFARLESMPCDVLITPHPEASRLFDRAPQDANGCRAYAQAARTTLAERVAEETAAAAAAKLGR